MKVWRRVSDRFQQVKTDIIEVWESGKSDKKGERTIRSETSKVSLVIFGLLLGLGSFMSFAAIQGRQAFNEVQNVYLEQFRAAEDMKEKGMDIIAIYFLLGTDHDLDLLMGHLSRFDGLIENFDKALRKLEKTADVLKDPKDRKNLTDAAAKTKKLFTETNNNARMMTFALLEGDKAKGSELFKTVEKDVVLFKEQINSLEEIVGKTLRAETANAARLMSFTTWFGIIGTLLAVFITLVLIFRLLKFLNVSLLPIANLMHNMRQAVFSINSDGQIISPVSKYSSTVFETDDIVGKNAMDVVYSGMDPNGENMSRLKTAMLSVFGEDDMQWMLMEDCFPPQVKQDSSSGEEKILKMTYTPLWNKHGALQNVMIVAEDVTEIEKLRQAAKKKEGEVALLKALVDMQRSEVETYLSDALGFVRDSRAIIPTIRDSREERQRLFRILHTLKGNSRMANLTVVSEVVHHAESAVVEINKLLDMGESVSDEMVRKLEDGLDASEDTLADLNRLAKRVFGVPDLFDQSRRAAFHRAFSELEAEARMCLPGGSTVDVWSDRVQQGLRVARKRALSFGFEGLAARLNDLESRWSAQDRVGALPIYAEVFHGYVAQAQENGMLSLQPKELSEKWVPFVSGLIELTLRPSPTAPEAQPADPVMVHLERICEEQEWRIFSPFMKMIATGLADDYEAGLRGAWRALISLGAFECTFELAPMRRRDLSQALRAADGDLTQLKDQPMPSVAKAFVAAVNRLGETKQNELGRILSMLLEMDSFSDVVEDIWGSPTSLEQLESFANELAKPCSPEDMKAHAHVLCEAAFVSAGKLLGDSFAFGQVATHLLRVFARNVPNSKIIDTSEATGSVEIPAKIFVDIERQVAELGRLHLEDVAAGIQRLQQSIGRINDVPLIPTIKKMESTIVEIASRLEKDVDFEVSGDELAFDRQTVSRLRDALVHLVRNSIDHGVEKPDERVDQGKSARAKIEVECRSYDSGGYELVIRDDGRGIDADRVAAKALENGAITKEQHDSMSFDERVQLIFLPNLSTKDEVSMISGRGVGMDAVKSTLEAMGGKVIVKTERGVGSEFILRVGEVEDLIIQASSVFDEPEDVAA